MQAEAWLWGKRIAYINLDKNGYINFEYTEEI